MPLVKSSYDEMLARASINERKVSLMARETYDEEKKQTVVTKAELPIGKEINDGSGEVYWRLLGWVPISEYETKKELEAAKAELKKGKKNE